MSVKAGGRTLLLRILPVLVGLLFPAALVWALACGAGSEGQGAESAVPQELAGFRLQRVVTGEQAVRDMERLHNREDGFGLLDGWVGYYENDATIWFGVAGDEEDASALIDDMASSIAQGNSPFTNLTKESIGDLVVYSVQGLGQLHFFYQRGVNVVWLAAPPGEEVSFFHEALQSID